MIRAEVTVRPPIGEAPSRSASGQPDRRDRFDHVNDRAIAVRQRPRRYRIASIEIQFVHLVALPEEDFVWAQTSKVGTASNRACE